MALVANGTTAAWTPQGGMAADLGDLQSVEFSKDGNPVDTTNLSDTDHVFEAGISSIEITATVNGSAPVPSVGDEGQLTISWNDGNSDSVSDLLVTNRTTSGEIDGAISTSLTFVPKDV